MILILGTRVKFAGANARFSIKPNMADQRVALAISDYRFLLFIFKLD